MKLLKKLKVPFILCLLIGSAVLAVVSFYIWGLPYIVTSKKLHNFLDKKIYQQYGINAVIDDVELTTKNFPYISFKAKDFELIKGNSPIFILKNGETKISLSKLRFKTIILKKAGADYIFADVNELLKLMPTEQKETKPSDWYVDIIGSDISVKDSKIKYTSNDISFDVNVKDVALDSSQKDTKYLHFDFNTLVTQGKNKIKVTLKDNNKFYIKKDRLYVDNSFISLNKSKLKFNGSLKDDKHFKFEISANEFNISNIVAIVESNVLIPNGSEMLSYFDNIEGDFDFKIYVDPKGIVGDVDLHHLCFIFIPIERVPIHLHNGKIVIGKNDILLKDFSGYYGTKTVNLIKLGGKIKDYMNSFRMDITADGIVTNDFAKFYLSPVIGVPLEIIGKAETRLIIKSIKDVFDLKWLFRIQPDSNLLVGGSPISKYKEKRVIVSNMQIKGTLLKIKNMDYYVTVPGVASFTKRKLISLHGLIDFANGTDFRVMGFEIEQPVPSAFLNIIMRYELFKGGTAVGRLTAVDGPKGVKLFGNLKLDKITIPSQRLYIDKAELKTNFDTMHINSSGSYGQSNYSVNGEFVNNIAFPFVVNDIVFTLDKMDFAKILDSFNMQGNTTETKQCTTEKNEDAPTFDITNLIIKKCIFRLGEGIYKDLDVKNLEANLTLDKNGELDLDSNKFDFAKGTSSCHVCCDIKNHLYHLKLGVRDVDSDMLATTILNLPKEISGKASGIIDLKTDDKLKLNGGIKFLVKKGTIGKIGLIEYVLNVASVFRNPIAMISPMTIFDLINVPNGEFDKIQGTLDIKDNIIESIKIKSFAPYLSAYIVGNYNLEKQDATLRIYTKMSNKKKGIYGFLRNISLSNIASRVSLGARNDVNYYSSEISELPKIEADEKDCQIFLTTVDGDIEHFNFLSSLKKLK